MASSFLEVPGVTRCLPALSSFSRPHSLLGSRPLPPPAKPAKGCLCPACHSHIAPEASSASPPPFKGPCDYMGPAGASRVVRVLRSADEQLSLPLQPSFPVPCTFTRSQVLGTRVWTSLVGNTPPWAVLPAPPPRTCVCVGAEFLSLLGHRLDKHVLHGGRGSW